METCKRKKWKHVNMEKWKRSGKSGSISPFRFCYFGVVSLSEKREGIVFMANFNIHISYGIGVSTAISSALLSSKIVGGEMFPVVFFSGVLGSIFPDADSDNSTSIGIVYRAFSFVSLAAFVWLMSSVDWVNVVDIWVGCVVLVAFLEVPVKRFFKKKTVHRGFFHSLLAAVFFTLSLTNILFHVFSMTPVNCFYTGLSFLAGYLTHLTLDEFYSIDMGNKKMKRSFGTALKLFSLKSPIVYLFFLVISLMLFYFQPITINTVRESRLELIVEEFVKFKERIINE